MNINQDWKLELEEYIRQGEPAKTEKSAAWQTAIGLQAVDGLQTSEYLLETAREHIEGSIDMAAAKQRIESYYEQKNDRKADLDNTMEADLVSVHIAELLGEKTFNDVFAEKSWYFRNALVRANYNNLQNGIHATTEFLELFFENLLLDAHHELKNRYLHVDYQNTRGIKSAKTGVPKCQNGTFDGTLEDLALLQAIAANPAITQKQLAEQTGKSERTVKRRMLDLQEKEYIRRVNGKRNGHWELQVIL